MLLCTCLIDKKHCLFYCFHLYPRIKENLGASFKIIEVMEMSYESSLGEKKLEIEDKGVPNVKYFLDSGTILTDLRKCGYVSIFSKCYVDRKRLYFLF